MSRKSFKIAVCTVSEFAQGYVREQQHAAEAAAFVQSLRDEFTDAEVREEGPFPMRCSGVEFAFVVGSHDQQVEEGVDPWSEAVAVLDHVLPRGAHVVFVAYGNAHAEALAAKKRICLWSGRPTIVAQTLGDMAQLLHSVRRDAEVAAGPW